MAWAEASTARALRSSASSCSLASLIRLTESSGTARRPCVGQQIEHVDVDGFVVAELFLRVSTPRMTPLISFGRFEHDPLAADLLREAGPAWDWSSGRSRSS